MVKIMSLLHQRMEETQIFAKLAGQHLMVSVYIVTILNYCFQKKPYLDRNALFKHIKSPGFIAIFVLYAFSAANNQY